MSEEDVKSLMRDFIMALAGKDIDKALCLCTENSNWITPYGTFKGKRELKRYLAWLVESIQDLEIKETGIGIVAEGNSAAYEHIFTGTIEGSKVEVLAICAFEFRDKKIQDVRAVYDRLSLAEQATKGWLAKRLVNTIVKQAEKGLQ